MKVIYPEETLALLAEYDKWLDKVRDEYQKMYPDPPEVLREILGEQRYAERYHDVCHKRRYAMLNDVFYQGFIQQKTKIIMRSPCTYLFDADEVSQWHKEGKP